MLIEGQPADEPKVVALLPRRTAIKRGAAGEHYKQQVIAANIDTVFIVCGLDADFNPRRIERYLLLVRGGAEPVVVLTKVDLAGGLDGPGVGEARATLAELAAQDIAVLVVNAKDRDSVAGLHRWLGPGQTAVLVGSSGAGKSTLTNTLLGIEKMKTGEVRESDARGRHTTTHRALIPLPSGACLIDTPGMRELKPTGEEDLAEGGFADVEAACRAMQVPRLQARARTRLRDPRGDRIRRARPRALRQLRQAARRGRRRRRQAGDAAGARAPRRR